MKFHDVYENKRPLVEFIIPLQKKHSHLKMIGNASN